VHKCPSAQVPKCPRAQVPKGPSAQGPKCPRAQEPTSVHFCDTTDMMISTIAILSNRRFSSSSKSDISARNIKKTQYWATLMSCSSALPSACQKSVFAYPKQRAKVLVGSVLKWRARPQCLRCQKSVFAYPKQRATVSVGSVLKWRARPQWLRRRRDFVLQMNNT
jgi:hypothetical protein